MGVLKDRYYSWQEYFDLLRELDYKIEYHDGRIVVGKPGETGSRRFL